MNKKDLELTLFNSRYGNEIIEKTLTSNNGSLQSQVDWLVTHPELMCFASTVTFKNLVRADGGMKKATLYEYNKRVLNKVRRRLVRSNSEWIYALPSDHITLYEYGEISHYKKVSGSKKYNHIHGVFAVRKQLAARIFNPNAYFLDDRLFKDIRSIPTVLSFKIEPLVLEESDFWLNYILKGKDLSRPLFD